MMDWGQLWTMSVRQMNSGFDESLHGSRGNNEMERRAFSTVAVQQRSIRRVNTEEQEL